MKNAGRGFGVEGEGGNGELGGRLNKYKEMAAINAERYRREMKEYRAKKERAQEKRKREEEEETAKKRRAKQEKETQMNQMALGIGILHAGQRQGGEDNRSGLHRPPVADNSMATMTTMPKMIPAPPGFPPPEVIVNFADASGTRGRWQPQEQRLKQHQQQLQQQQRQQGQQKLLLRQLLMQRQDAPLPLALAGSDAAAGAAGEGAARQWSASTGEGKSNIGGGRSGDAAGTIALPNACPRQQSKPTMPKAA